MIDLLFFLITRLNNACSALVIIISRLINRSGLRISHLKVSSSDLQGGRYICNIFKKSVQKGTDYYIYWKRSVQKGSDYYIEKRHEVESCCWSSCCWSNSWISSWTPSILNIIYTGGLVSEHILKYS